MARLADITLEIRTNRLLAGARAAQTAGDLGDATTAESDDVTLALTNLADDLAKAIKGRA